ncbi:MAG TPA: hypothetical protein VGI83_02225 [Gemmatimonadales bacterium]|jgi:hypothetical protein
MRTGAFAPILLIAALGCPRAPQPTVSIAPTDWDFGSVQATVKNTHCPQGAGTHNMTITVFSPRDGLGYMLAMSPGDFMWFPDTLLPAAFPKGTSTYTVPITFTPHYTGAHTAIASVVLLDPAALPSNIVDLKGKGVCEF